MVLLFLIFLKVCWLQTVSYEFCKDVHTIDQKDMKYCNPEYTDSECCQCDGNTERRCQSVDDKKYYPCCPCTAWIDAKPSVAKCDCSRQYVAQENGAVKQVDFTYGFEHEVPDGSDKPMYKFYCTNLNQSSDAMPWVQAVRYFRFTTIQWICTGAAGTFFCINCVLCCVLCGCFWSYELCPSACNWGKLFCKIGKKARKNRKKAKKEKEKKSLKKEEEKEKKKKGRGRDRGRGRDERRQKTGKDRKKDYDSGSDDYSDDYDDSPKRSKRKKRDRKHRY